jgi:hypothetical protein
VAAPFLKIYRIKCVVWQMFLQDSIHSKLNYVVEMWKNCKKNWTECSLAQHRFTIRFVKFLLVLCVFSCVWHRVVGRKTEQTVGFPEWTAQFSVWKTAGKDSFAACIIVCQNCAFYSVFPSGMTLHSKIALFGIVYGALEKWKFINVLTHKYN